MNDRAEPPRPSPAGAPADGEPALGVEPAGAEPTEGGPRRRKSRLGWLKSRVLRRRPTRNEVLVVLLAFAFGVILLFAAAPPRSDLGSVLRSVAKEFGIVIIGTVLVSLAYELVVRPAHDEQLLLVVKNSLIAQGAAYGLSGIEALDLLRIIRKLGDGDELCWLETYCPGVELPDVRSALTAALAGGATIRMLMIDPERGRVADRAREIGSLTAAEFRRDAQIKRGYLDRFKGTLKEDAKKRLTFAWYTDLPCAPMYLRLQDKQVVEGWTSYFLSEPTDEAAHLYWSRPASRSDDLPVGLGLDAFLGYFNKKWTIAVADTDARASMPELLDDETLEEFASVGDRPFVTSLLKYDLERNLGSVLQSGTIRRDQDAKTRELMLQAAMDAEHDDDKTVLLVHSTSENAIFTKAFWKPFNEQLRHNVELKRLKGVRRLFILRTHDEPARDQVLKEQIAYHDENDNFECRLLLSDEYRANQTDERVTPLPVHDFGIYGPVAYVWPLEGYGAGEGYFQVDRKVDEFRRLYERCWKDAVPPAQWPVGPVRLRVRGRPWARSAAGVSAVGATGGLRSGLARRARRVGAGFSAVSGRRRGSPAVGASAGDEMSEPGEDGMAP